MSQGDNANDLIVEIVVYLIRLNPRSPFVSIPLPAWPPLTETEPQTDLHSVDDFALNAENISTKLSNAHNPIGPREKSKKSSSHFSSPFA